jgi:hypothetical protein
MLNMGGANLDVDARDPSEQVSEEIVRRLYERRRDDSPVGRRLGQFLEERSPGTSEREGRGAERFDRSPRL